MSTKNPIWEEYIVLGDTVNIRSSDGSLDKRKLFPNIDDTLLLENRISFLEDIYSKEIKNIEAGKISIYNPLFVPTITLSALILQRILMLNFPENQDLALYLPATFILGANLGKYKLDRYKSKSIVDGSLAVNKLCEVEISKCRQSLIELSEEKIDENKIIREKLIPVMEDRDYCFEVVDRIDRVSTYGNIRRRLKSNVNKGTLDKYLDSIGCSDDDKLIFKELLGSESRKTATDTFQYKKK